MLAYGVFLLMLLSPPVLWAARYGRRFEETIGLSLAAEILLLYLMGLLGLLRFAVPAFAVLAAGCLIAALWHARKNPKGFLSALCTPAFVCFLLFAPVCYLSNIGRSSIFHDEFVHWQLVVKLMDRVQDFWGNPAVVRFALYDYYPGVTLFEYLGVQLMGLRDGAVYVAFQLLWMGLLLGGMQGTSWRRPLKALGAAALLFTCNMLFFPFTMLRLVVDPIMAVLVAMLCYVLAFPDPSPRFDRTRFALLLWLLTLSKNDSGWILVVGLLLARFLLQRGWRHWRRDLLPMAMLLVASALAWKLYVGYSGIQCFFPTETMQNLRALFGGTLDPIHRSVPARFLSWFVSTPYRSNDIYVAYAIPTTSLVLCLALAVLSALLYACTPKPEKKSTARVLLVLWGLALAYIAGIVCAYTFSLQVWEAEQLNDIARYITAAWLWIGLALSMLVIRRAQASRSMTALGAGLLVLALAFGNNGLIRSNYLTHESTILTQWQQETRSQPVAFLEARIPKGSRLRILGSTGETLYYGLRYLLVPDYELLPYGGRWEDVDRSPETIRDTLAKLDYVYVAERWPEDPDYALDTSYAPLFEGGEAAILSQSLYRVVQDTDGPILQYIETFIPSWQNPAP